MKTKQLFLFLMLTLTGMSWGQTTLVNYKFENNLNAESGAIGSPTLTNSTAVSYFGGVTGQSVAYASSTNKYFDLVINTTGYDNLKISFSGRSSQNGSQWEVTGDSNGGTSFTSITSFTCPNGSFGTLSSTSIGNNYSNKSSIKIRIKAIGTSATLRLDDLVLIGTISNQAPTASSVAIGGTLASGSVLTGSYTYADNENNPQGDSTFKWYRADDASGTGSLPISGATSTTYTLTPSDIGKYIRFGVVPVASAGTTTGVETFSSWSGAIGAGSTPVLNIAATLTEANLTTETITLTLTNDTFADATLDASNFILNNAPAGVTVAAVVYVSATEALLSLAYTNTDFDTNITNFNITINGAELTSASNLTAANNLTITALTETLTATGTLAFGTLCSNVTPSKASFVISGSNAKDGTIDLAALSGYTYSETENGTYTSTLSVSQTAGTVNKTIWVTFSPTLAQTYNGNIVISGVGAPNVNKAVTGTGKIPVTGVVTTTAASAVASTSATLNGNLTTLGVCPATTEKGFVYCLTADSVNPVIEDSFADVESTTSSISTGNYSLNATLLTQGTSYTYRAFIYNGTDYVYGTAQSFITTATEPTNQPTSLVRSAVTTDGMTLNWTAATSNPVGYLVLRTTAVGATYPSTNPVDGTTYTVGTVLGNATVMFAGSGTEAIVSGLSPESQYSYEVYSYNGSGATINYRTSSPLQGQFYTLALEPTQAVSNVAISNISNNSATVTATNINANGVAIFMKSSSATDYVPSDAVSYTSGENASYGTGTSYNGSYLVLLSATSPYTVSATNLLPETTYYLSSFNYNGFNSDLSNNFYNIPNITSFTTLATTPTTAASAITFGTSTINTITVNSVTNGNGANRIMVVRPASASRVAPTNGITYTPNSLSFTDGANPTTGTNNIVVFNGTTISNQTITDLAINTNYTIDVYEYNGTSATTVYYYAASASASKTTLNLSAPVAIAADPVSTNSFTAKWDAVVGATGYQLDVSAYESFGILTPTTSSESFESGLTTSYQTGNVTFSSGTWAVTNAMKSTSTGVKTGSSAAQLQSATGSALVSPTFNSVTTISFWVTSSIAAGSIQVNYSTDGGQNWITATGSPFTNIGTTSTQKTVTINTTGETIIQIYRTAGTIYIDDLVINHSVLTPSFISGYNSKEISGGATLSENITGLADETAYYYRVRAVNGSVVSANSNTITVTTETATTTWVATNGGEWTNGAPTTVTDAIIDFPYNTTTAPIIAENLTVTTNGTLTVSATNPVTIHGNLINTNATAGAINVLNGGTLLQPNNTTTNGNTGNITYNRNTANLQNNDFVYWSSPVSGAKATSMGSIDKIYDFNHSSQAWNHINLNPTANPLSSIALANGVGYAVRFIGASNNPNTAAFEGVPNNGDVTITGITSSGAEKYMLLGNPYPSAIDLELLQDDNAAVLGQTFYFWTHANAYNGTNYNDADYATYNVELGAGTAGTNNGTAGTRYVSAGQGFFADLNSAGMSSATLTFKNSHRVVDNNANFFRSAATQTTTQNTSAAKIWFNFKNENAFKQTLLAYTPNAINGYDPVDATTFDGQPHVDFYTLADNKKMVIQARAPFVNTDIVPMGYRVSNAGTYTLEIDHLDNVWNTQNIYVKDNALNVVHDIKANPYSFTTPAGVFDTRFEIIYQTNALSNPDVSFDKAVIVFAKDKNIHINSGLETIKDVVVYDLQGRIITTKTNINATQAILTNVRAEEQVLLVKVTSTEGKITTKKVVF